MIQLYKEEFLPIAQIRKGHGFKGHAKIIIDEEWVEDLLIQDFVFLEIDGYKVPFPIESTEDKKDIVLKLGFIDSLEALRPFFKFWIYILEKDVQYNTRHFIQEEKKEELQGFRIIDRTKGELGVILRIEEFPQQLMAFILHQKEEKMIPLHQDLIIELDTDNKKVIMDLPEGLV